MTLAFWQAGNLPAAGRSVRDWARRDPERPAPHRFAARIYEDMGAIDLAAEAADRVAARAPSDADAWERVGRLRLRLLQSEAARNALETARRLAPSVEGLLDLALAHHLTGDVGGEVAATRAGRGAGARQRRAPGRAMRTRSPAPTASARESRHLSAPCSSIRATPRSPSCSSACATRCRGCCLPRRLRRCPPPAPMFSSPRSSRSASRPCSGCRASTTSRPGRRCASRRSA